MTSAGTGTPNPSEQPKFTTDFRGVLVAQSYVFSVLFCKSLFVLFLLTIVLSILLRCITSGYACGLFKLVLAYYSVCEE